MRHLRIPLATLVLTLGLGVAAQAAAEPAAPISKIQARALPTEALKQRVAAQIADMLVESPRPTVGKTPRRPLGDLWFRTRPVTTGADGVCQSDTVVVAFRSKLAPGEGDADTPVHASSLSATPNFYVAEEGEKVRCGRLDPFDPRFLRAATAQKAKDGTRLLRAVAAGAAEAKPPFTTQCGGADCASWLTPLKLADISDIEDCTRDEDIAAGRSCTKFSTPILYLTVVQQGQGQALKILSVSADELIITGDYRQD